MADRKDKITGILLAGGQGRRMGGVDKGLQLLRGKPMAQHVIERFAPQVDELLINANQNIEQYQGLGYRVIPDAIGGFVGPLAGLHRGLSEANNAELAVAKTGDQPHPVFSLCRTSVLPSLTAFLESGGRKIDLWYSQLKAVEVQFTDEAAFRNINTREELSQNGQL